MKDRTFLLHFNSDIESINDIALFIDNLGIEGILSEATLFNLNLVLEEIVTNIILYGIANVVDGSVEVEIVLGEAQLEIHIADNGIAFDPTVFENDPVKGSLEEQQIGGLGIFFVKKLTNSMKYQRIESFNHLYLSLKISE